jgi:hypothetical protein
MNRLVCVTDRAETICLDEAALDEWFRSLPFEAKAEFYEGSLTVVAIAEPVIAETERFRQRFNSAFRAGMEAGLA